MKILKQLSRLALGDTAWQWTLGSQISLDINRLIHELVRQLNQNQKLRKLGVCDMVPTYHAFALYFPDHPWNREEIAALVEAHIERQWPSIEVGASAVADSTQLHSLVVAYEGDDLARISKFHAIPVEEVIQRHQMPEYQVAMIGFLPHFPYLMGLDALLETPRLDKARTRVPAGSVAIGGKQTGIYPQVSPGGWNIIGYSDPEVLPSIRPGDRVRFCTA